MQIAAETIVRGYERQTEQGKKQSVVPFYEYLRLDYGNLKGTGLTVHLNGWGRVDAADSYNRSTSSGELLHAYLQYLSPDRGTVLRVGRQYVLEGVARDSLDGVYGKKTYDTGVSASAYAGSPVTMSYGNGRAGDIIFGGKLAHTLPGIYDLGVSYKQVRDNGHTNDETVGADLMVQLPGNASLLGRSAYNPASGGWKEHSYELRMPVGPIALTPFIQHYNYSDYFSNRSGSSSPFRYLQGSSIRLTIAGAEACWYPSDRQEYVLKVKNHEYSGRFNSSQLYSLLAIWKLAILSETGVEFGRMQGNDRENRYYLGRGYFFWDIKPAFLTGEAMYVHYDRDIYRKNHSLFASLGGGSKFFNDALSVKLSMDYSSDPYFDEDIRWMLKVSYLFDKPSSEGLRR